MENTNGRPSFAMKRCSPAREGGSMLVKRIFLILSVGFLGVLVLTVATSFAQTTSELSKEKVYVEWVDSGFSPIGTADAGEQPGWTKAKTNKKYKEQVLNKEDAKYCLEHYRKEGMLHWEINLNEIKKVTITVKHEQREQNAPILRREPTIKPYKIEVFSIGSQAVDWDGNIYQYQTWA